MPLRLLYKQVLIVSVVFDLRSQLRSEALTHTNPVADSLTERNPLDRNNSGGVLLMTLLRSL
jgi:hypothetical protein